MEVLLLQAELKEILKQKFKTYSTQSVVLVIEINYFTFFNFFLLLNGRRMETNYSSSKL